MNMLHRFMQQRRVGNCLGAILCSALLAYALYVQHVLHLEPCPLCVFQRVAVIALGVIFLLAAVHHPKKVGARIYGALLAVVMLGGCLVALRHIWIQAQPPGSVAACGATLEYMLDVLPVTTVITKVLTGSGECGKIDWQLFGLSMPWWVLFALLGLGMWAVWVNIVLPLKLRQ